jgi:hypothetical protein
MPHLPPAGKFSTLLIGPGWSELVTYEAVDLFNQGKWEDLWKLANKAGERAKARAANNPRRSKPK